MTLRDIINKEFEVITEETRKEKKVVKIFYKLNLNLIKPAQTSEQPEQQDNEANIQQPENNTQIPQQQDLQQNTQIQNNMQQPENNTQLPQIDVS